ncbi:AMP-binding protein [Sneathiella chungangensis]|uniref:AMP-binding protein n=3 Tax=Sneathiella chungangensis TaxID=1418234 RepID=A0A845MHM3_9PROT|nr:AMP-binding protein [Sneathiella chungangensis]
MALVEGADFVKLEELSALRQSSWERQIEYVSKCSAFFQQQWEGRTPPRSLKDIAALPLCDKGMLRISQANHPPFGDYLAAPDESVNRLHRTSGTTGQAMNLALSARDSHVTAVVGGRSQRAAGLGPGHRVVHCLNYQMWMGGLTDHMTLEQTGALVVPFGVGSTKLLIQTILDLKITAISCTPSYPAVLEQVIAEHFPDITPRDLGLKLGLFGGEAGLDSPDLRRRLKGIWGMEPRNANYGVSDVFCNFASQCEHDTDLHFLGADVLYPELIDPDTAEVLPIQPGISGELVLTHLERDCQPLVRFRTGDVLKITATDPCKCGRTGFRFRVIGRSDDMVVVRGINVFPTMVAAVINGNDRLSGEYRIRLNGSGPYSQLPLEVELASKAASGEELAAEVERQIKEKLGVTASVTLVDPGGLPRTSGKTKRVVREDLA